MTCLNYSRPDSVLLAWIFLLSVVCIGEILPAKSTPMQLLSATEVSDKVLHATAYFVLAVIPAWAFSARKAVICLFVAGTIGCVLEGLQRFVPGRSSDGADLVANTVGLIGGVLVAVAVRQASRRIRFRWRKR